MLSRLFTLILILEIGICAAAYAGDAVDISARRAELEKRYPDIDFNWPDLPPEGSEISQPAAITMEPRSSDREAERIAKQEILLRQNQSGLIPSVKTRSPATTVTQEAPRKRRRAYTLGPGDVISINVRDHPEFSSYGTRVGFAGEVILPLTNEVIYAEGLTATEVREKIEEKLRAYIAEPFVSVFITEFNSKKFYILGEIGAGIYPIGDTSIKLMDALYAAGLPAEGIAAMRRVQIITPHETDPINRWVNVYAILYKGRMQHNITIEPGTIIYVPTTFFTKLSRVIRQISVTAEDLSQVPSDLAAFDSGLIAWDQSWNLDIFPKGINF